MIWKEKSHTGECVERLSKFLTDDKRARWPRQEDGHCFKRRKYRRLGSNPQLKLEAFLEFNDGLLSVFMTWRSFERREHWFGWVVRFEG